MSAGSNGSLALFDDDSCELVHRNATQTGTYTVAYNGDIKLVFPHGTYNITMTESLQGFIGSGSNGLSVAGYRYTSPNSGSGQVFRSPGRYTYVVPLGVTQIRVRLLGAGGEGAFAGAGGYASGLIDVFGGDNYTIEVGGPVLHLGKNSPAGGGRSAFYAGGATGLEELLVAGGGGGSGSSIETAGGAGGGVEGQTAAGACDAASCVLASPASGGTAAAGGVAGRANGAEAPTIYIVRGENGGRNAAGRGVTAGDAVRQGAAGGGGYYGGGSGGANDTVIGGGGGGSGYIASKGVKEGVLIAGNWSQPPTAFALQEDAGRPNQPGLVYIQVECPTGTTDEHPETYSPW